MADLPDLLHKIADDLLDVCEAALREGGLDVPNRRFIDYGSVTAPITFGDDCESQLAVIIGPLRPDPRVTNLRSGNCAILWRAKFLIALTRCYAMYSGDEGSPLPTAAQIDNEARLHYEDMWQLARVLAYKWTHGELVPSHSFSCEMVDWGTIDTIPPSGGVRGVQISLDVSVHDKYEPEADTPGWED